MSSLGDLVMNKEGDKMCPRCLAKGIKSPLVAVSGESYLECPNCHHRSSAIVPVPSQADLWKLHQADQKRITELEDLLKELGS